MANALFSEVTRAWDSTATPLNDADVAVLMRAARHAEATYRSPEWTWRR
jgi:hypothetical protein